MRGYGKILADSHKLSTKGAANPLLTRLDENEDVLVSVYGLLTKAVKADRRVAPAGEWLLDNFYLIEEQIRLARRHLPKSYSRELPRLMNGPSAGLPRVYDIALETISHGDGRLDMDSLGSFVASYQTITTLRLGELWAIPTMLRFALIENEQRISQAVTLVVIRSVDSYSVFTTQPGEHVRGWPSQPCRRSTLATSAAMAHGSHLTWAQPYLSVCFPAAAAALSLVLSFHWSSGWCASRPSSSITTP